MKRVKVQYVAGSDVCEVELVNVGEWTTRENNSMSFLDEDGETIAEFTNVLAVIRVYDGPKASPVKVEH